jgi:hypothetical protein
VEKFAGEHVGGEPSQNDTTGERVDNLGPALWRRFERHFRRSGVLSEVVMGFRK